MRIPYGSLTVLTIVLTVTPSAPSQAAPDAKRLADLPISFERNVGQTDAAVKFTARGPGYRMFLTSSEAVLVLQRELAGTPDGRISKRRPSLVRDMTGGLGNRGQQPAPQILRIALFGADTDATVTGLDELPGKANYFIGTDPARWRTNVPTYARVRYTDVYPGVDVIYYGNGRELEYDIVVGPHADPDIIKLSFDSATRVEVDASGDLVLTLPGGTVRQKKPVVSQHIQGAKRLIDSHYVVHEGRVGFAVAVYDRGLPLVIDPVLSYSTYLGGSDLDIGQAIAVDGSGNAYVAGITASMDFPTAHPAQAAPGGGFDAFVTKLNANGSGLIYSTYLGGSGDDSANGIAVDAAGNAYVVGATASTNFPTARPTIQTKNGGGVFDAFVTKLNPQGSGLVYSTYLGGNGDDEAFGVAIDAVGHAYVTGFTASSNFPTAKPLQAASGGGYDAFVAKVHKSGSHLVYSTYLGGSSDDFALGVAVDVAANAYVTGLTASSNFPTVTPFQAVNRGDPFGFDAFVTKLNGTGSALGYSTYLGGSTGDDTGLGIAVDATGSAYVTGQTSSSDFPTLTTIQPTYGGGFSDAFVTRLTPGGSAIVYSTYLGGNDADAAAAIALDTFGNAHVTGETLSSNFPTMDPIQSSNHGGGDAFVTKLNSAGTALVYSTFLGGAGEDAGHGVAIDKAGAAYVTGQTGSVDFPTTSGAFSETPHSAWVAKIVDSGTPPPPPSTTGKLTGSGTIAVGGGAASFNFEVSHARANEPIKGQLSYVDRSAGANVASVAITSLAIVGNTAMFSGTCTNNRTTSCSFTVSVVDNGSPGSSDKFSISISDGPTAGGTLRSGNIEIHQ